MRRACKRYGVRMGGGVWCAMCISSLPGLQVVRLDSRLVARHFMHFFLADGCKPHKKV